MSVGGCDILHALVVQCPAAVICMVACRVCLAVLCLHHGMLRMAIIMPPGQVAGTAAFMLDVHGIYFSMCFHAPLRVAAQASPGY